MTEGEKAPWLDANDIKSRVSIRAVLEHYGIAQQLKGDDMRLRGLSPFRDETKPSFFVDLSKNIWNDFPRPTVGGKEVPGNVIGLVMGLESIGFRDALLRLHQTFVGETRQEVSRQLKDKRDNAPSTASPKEAVTEENGAENTPFGKELKGLRYEVPYLQDKGLSQERARFWKAGYCSRGMMKGRVVVPIADREGVILGYAGRSLKEGDENGKWKFPNGFAKSKFLFNLDKIALDEEARGATKRFGLIVVEGFTDAILLSERGFKNVVSVMGTEITDAQQELLLDEKLNPSQRLTLFFDADDPGRAGRKKAAAKLIHSGFVRYVDLKRIDAKTRTDPDEFTREELQVLLGPCPTFSQEKSSSPERCHKMFRESSSALC